MVPPQERPTFQAVSSATPNSSILGLPESITSSASVTTAPSTQPPDTEPRKLPSVSITSLDPTGRGAEPQVSTTVASATPRPARRQSSAALRMSSSLASMNCLLRSRCIDRNMVSPGSLGQCRAESESRGFVLKCHTELIDGTPVEICNDCGTMARDRHDG